MDYLNKLLSTLILLALMLPTFAQESEDEEEGLEVVVTTATKTEKDILDTCLLYTSPSPRD